MKKLVLTFNDCRKWALEAPIREARDILFRDMVEKKIQRDCARLKAMTPNEARFFSIADYN